MTLKGTVEDRGGFRSSAAFGGLEPFWSSVPMQACLLSVMYTPKTNMDPENHWVVDEDHL